MLTVHHPAASAEGIRKEGVQSGDTEDREKKEQSRVEGGSCETIL